MEEVATGVSLGVLLVDSAGSVEWLMQVSNVVDEKTEGVGFGVIFVGDVLLDGSVDK